MPSKRISRPIAGRLSLLGVWCIAPALGAGEPVQLEPIVITATLAAEDLLNLPYTISTVEEEAIRVERAARTLPQALAEEPAVSLQKTAQGMESPYIRGFTGFRTLLLVDGIRLNNATFREGPNQYWGLVDALAIGRIEMVKGPASVLWGSDAIGGTVNAMTIEDMPAGIHPGAYYRFGSAEDAHLVRGETRGTIGENVGYTGGVTWRDFGDLRGGTHTGRQDYTGYESLSGDAKVRWNVSDRLTIASAFQSADHFGVPRTHTTIYGVSWRGTQAGTDLRREIDHARRMAYVRAEALPDTEWLEKLTLTISYQLMTEDEDRIRASGVNELQGFEDHTGGANVTAVSPSPAGTWTYGVEWYGDWVEDSYRKDLNADGSVRRVYPRGPMADDARYDSVGVFIQDEYEPVERFTLIAGARYNYNRASGNARGIDSDPIDDVYYDDLDESFEAAVGSGRVLYRVTDNLTPFAGVSQGFRAPNLADLTRFDIARTGEFEVPATDLDPEYFIACEAGVKGRWERWGGAVSYYYTDIDDMIMRYGTGDVTADGEHVVSKANVGDGYLHGVEADLSWSFYEGFTARGSFSWMDGEVDTYGDAMRTSRKPISRLMPAQWLVGLRWDSEDRKVWVEGTARIALRQERLSPDDERDTTRIPPDGTPGYCIFALRGGVRLDARTRLFAGVENITNRDYRIHGSGVNGPGTSFVAGLQMQF